jgi:hypothetical protein
VGAQQRLEVEVARVVDQHGIARPQQQAADQVDCLRARAGEHELVGGRRDALVGETGEEQAAQRRRAARAAVVRQEGVAGATEGPQALAQGGVRHPVGGQPAATGLEHGSIGVERLSRYPERIDAALARRSRLGERARRQVRPGDVEAGAAPGADDALRLEPPVGLDDRRRRNAHGRGKAADRGQAIARAQRPARDPGADRIHERPGPRPFDCIFRHRRPTWLYS